MTGQERDYGEVLSRVLHSTTDRIEPVGDGLTKIQARLAEPWLKRQWWLLRNEFVVLRWVLAVRCQSWFSTVRSGSAAGGDEATTGAGAAGDGGRLRSLSVLGGIIARASAKRSRNDGALRRSPVGPAMAWFRPALAVAGAVVLVVAGVVALGQIRETFASFENSSHPGTSTSSHGGGAGNPNGSGGPVGTGRPSATQGQATSAKPGSTPSGKMSLSPAFVSPSPSPASANPSPTTSPSPQSPPPSSPPPSSPPPTTSSGGPLSSSSPTTGPPAGG